jgi:hypothetical protein
MLKYFQTQNVPTALSSNEFSKECISRMALANYFVCRPFPSALHLAACCPPRNYRRTSLHHPPFPLGKFKLTYCLKNKFFFGTSVAKETPAVDVLLKLNRRKYEIFQS